MGLGRRVYLDAQTRRPGLRLHLAAGILGAENAHDVSVFCCFDNEEVGSETKQGAMSTFLADALRRINGSLGFDDESYHRALAASMLVSCDNAHAVHPNHAEKCDAHNQVVLNGGIVIKEAANQHYCTDAFSRAVFQAICDDADVPTQAFANKSDMAGGSTLGNLSNMQASMHAVDVGLPQLAMHSSYETGGVRDVMYAIRALTAFYERNLTIKAPKAWSSKPAKKGQVYFGRFYLGKCRNANGKRAARTPSTESTPAKRRR